MGSGKKGLVIDIEKDTAIILTPAGEFINLNLSKRERLPELGEEVILPSASRDYRHIMMNIAAIAALLVLFMVNPVRYTGVLDLNTSNVTSYVTIDINPSIELSVGKSEQVVAVKALNDDGDKVIDAMQTKLLGQPSDQAVEMIVSRAIALGYLKEDTEDQHILITHVNVNSEEKVATAQTYINNAQKVLAKENIQAQVDLLTADSKMRSKANEHQLSTGKYLLLLEAAVSNEDEAEILTAAESGNLNTVKLSAEAWKRLVVKAKQEKDFEQLEKQVAQKFQELKQIHEKSPLNHDDKSVQNTNNTTSYPKFKNESSNVGKQKPQQIDRQEKKEQDKDQQGQMERLKDEADEKDNEFTNNKKDGIKQEEDKKQDDTRVEETEKGTKKVKKLKSSDAKDNEKRARPANKS